MEALYFDYGATSMSGLIGISEIRTNQLDTAIMKAYKDARERHKDKCTCGTFDPAVALELALDNALTEKERIYITFIVGRSCDGQMSKYAEEEEHKRAQLN